MFYVMKVQGVRGNINKGNLKILKVLGKFHNYCESLSFLRKNKLKSGLYCITNNADGYTDYYKPCSEVNDGVYNHIESGYDPNIFDKLMNIDMLLSY